MTFKHFLLASCALVISATAATAQIPSYVPTDGLVGWWPFNGNANDESGNGNDGVVNGATLTSDRFGNPNTAQSFSPNSYIEVLDTTQFNFAEQNQMSISFWMKATSANNPSSQVRIPISKQTGAGSFQLGWNNYIEDTGGNLGMVVKNGTTGIQGYYFISNLGYLDGSWHLFSTTFNNGLCSIYMDNVLLNTSTTSGVIIGNNSGNLRFGQVAWSSIASFSGQLDDIAIYNRALTPQEIQNLYNSSTETVDTGDGAAPLPQGIPYQAAARDAQGQSLVNAAVNVRFTLHEGAADGAASYAETHALTTNNVGLFNTVFGNGTPEQSAFDSINWAATTKFLQVEIDLGEGYVDMGTTQLLSVPYALRSDEAARVKNAGLPIFNDNAAALAGGLVAGEMYRTAAGVLMIVY
jgi:hypothetical protein